MNHSVRRLELVMTTPHLSDDDVRDLFSDHFEGALDEATTAAVDAALQANAGLKAEHQAFVRTMALLQDLPRPEASPQLVAQVRGRLAAERRAGVTGPNEVVTVVDNVVPLAPKSTRPGTSTMRLVASFAAIAAVVAVVMIGGPRGMSSTPGANGTDAMLGAGLGDTAVAVVWQAPGVEHSVIVHMAREAGMDTDGDTFVGDQRAAARFFVNLKTSAVGSGTDVSGPVPERAERVVVTVTR
jgi:hypothetical protein